MKRLPIGIQIFSKICEDEYCFLSRPNRFEKLLPVSTLKAVFSTQKELLKGLYVGKNWDRDIEYPVIDISFGGGVNEKCQNSIAK